MWDLSCPDWEERIRTGRSLIPDLPLIRSEAEMGLAFFDELKLPDVPGKPRLGDAAGQWFRDIVATSFGSWDPASQQNFIRDIFVLAPKGSSKTSYGAGMELAVMLMNRRPRAEALFIGPTQAISDRAYEQAVGMIEESPDLKRRFRPRDHLKTIEDLVNGSEMKVKTFDLNILTGAILIFAHLDEVHLLGKSPYAGKVIRQIRGGIDKTPEGKFLITTTESDDIPAGAFKDELHSARKHRDGEFRDKEARPTLAVMYEFPDDIAKDPAKWRDPANWPMVQPNLGRSVHMKDLVQGWNSDKDKGERSIREWASQYLNIEMGVGHKTDGWPGAEFWAGAEEPELDLDSLIERSEAIVVGIDGGGLDDLFGASALGREKATKTWLSVSKAWCHKSVLERRLTIAARLLDFARLDEIEIIDDEFVDVAALVTLLEPCDALLLPKDVAGVLILVSRVLEAGKLAAVAIDVEGPYGELADALALIGVTQENKNLVGVGQGYRLMNAIKTSERKLANGTLKHQSSQLMDWCVGNIRIEPTATAIRATKQNAGDAKIDPAMALFDAVSIMVTNPEPIAIAGSSYLDHEEVLVF
ncbi:terminase large subunit [Mesorhizobium sp. M0768]|uniref:terminase large subunit n=1 Tax=Mesorhizobium sp. M0768 TaxID=2956996 RepID=UPI003338AE90